MNFYLGGKLIGGGGVWCKLLLEVATLLFGGILRNLYRRYTRIRLVPKAKPKNAPITGSHTYSASRVQMDIPEPIKKQSVNDSLSTLSPCFFSQCLCISLKTCVPSNRDSAVKYPSELYHFVYFFVKIIETPAAFCSIFHDFGMRCRP